MIGLGLVRDAQSQPIRNSRTERPTSVVVERAERAFDSDALASPLIRAAFSASGRTFELDLESNDRIKSGLDAEQQKRVANVRLYRGTLRGRPGSWVRLAERSGEITGILWDGLDLYAVEIRDGESLLFRTDEVFPEIRASLAGDFVYAAAIGGREPDFSVMSVSSAVSGPITGRTIEVGVVADSVAVAEGGADIEGDLLSIMNNVDGIFLWQVGVQISVADIVLIDAVADPFISTDSGQFLAALSAFKASSASLGSLGLVHLFTGRNIASQGSTQGVANISSVCDPQSSVGITQFRAFDGLVTEYLVATHEIAHNFGAPHDNEPGSACAATPGGFLMERFVNGSETFSQCSIDQMLPNVAGRTCFVPWQPNDLSLRFITGPSQVDYQDTDSFFVAIDTNGPTTGNVVELFVEASGAISLGSTFARAPPNVDFECNNGAYPRYCRASYIPEGTSVEFEIRVRAENIGTGDVTVRVHGGNDPNHDNDVVVHTITVPPAVDLIGSIEVLPGQSLVADDIVVHPGTLVQLSASVRNAAPDLASDVTAEIYFESDATDYRVSGAGVTCGGGLLPHWLICELGALGAGEERKLDLSFVSSSPPVWSSHSNDITRIRASADQFDFEIGNNEDQASVTVANNIFELETNIVDPGPLAIGATGHVIFSMANLGPDPAPDARIETDQFPTMRDAGLEYSVTTDTGTCTLNPNTGHVNCEYGTLAVGQRVETTVTVKGNQAASVRIRPGFGAIGYPIGGWSFASIELVVLDNTPPPPPPNPTPSPSPTPAPSPSPPAPAPASSSGGGGGGAVDWMLALLLLATAVFRAARLRRYMRSGAAMPNTFNPRARTRAVRSQSARRESRVASSGAFSTGHVSKNAVNAVARS